MAGEQVPAKSDESALDSLLKRAISHDKIGAVMPRDLVQFGLLGSGIVILAGLVALVLPDPSSIKNGHGPVFHWHFFLMFRSMAAGLDSFVQAMAIPGIVAGLLLLVLDAFLTQIPTREHWRLAIVGQAAAGGVGATVGVLFLAVFILNLIVWAIIIVVIAAFCIGVVFAFLAALSGG
jgi:hypothetical protein